MALNKLNYNFQPIDFKSGLGELVGNFREGQKMREDREKYGQDREGRGYGNMIKAAEAMYAPRTAEAGLGLTEAQRDNQIAQTLVHNIQAQGYDIANQDALEFLQYLKSKRNGGQPSQQMPEQVREEPSYNGMGSSEPLQQGVIQATDNNFTPIGQPETPKFNRDGEGPSRQRPASGQNSEAFNFADPLEAAYLKKHGIEEPAVEQEKRKGLNEVTKKRYERSIEAVESAGRTLDILDTIEDIYKQFPADVQNASGPLNKTLAKYIGYDETQRVLGALEVESGLLQAELVKSFGGQAKQVEFQLADRTKYNPNDSVSLGQGKIAAQRALVQIAHNRENSIASDIEKGYNAREAEEYARKAYPVQHISEQLRRLEKETKNNKKSNPFKEARQAESDDRLKKIFGTSDPLEMF